MAVVTPHDPKTMWTGVGPNLFCWNRLEWQVIGWQVDAPIDDVMRGSLELVCVSGSSEHVDQVIRAHSEQSARTKALEIRQTAMLQFPKRRFYLLV